MIINGNLLLNAAPISNMNTLKQNYKGTSFGLSEAGYDIRIKQNVMLDPKNRFQLASAVEYFHMPDNLLGVVHDKSTWARRGLSVFNTVIEPGWQGYLTLELIYHGSEPFQIYGGQGIAQVLFHEISDSASYNGKYQNQEDRPIEARS